MKKIVLILFLALVQPASYAQYFAAEGFYSSDVTQLQVMILDAEEGVAAAKASVNQGGCSGTLAGIGKFIGRKLTLSPYSKLEGAESCALVIEFDSKWRRATLIENDYCTPYHGVACGWEGQSVTKNANKR